MKCHLCVNYIEIQTDPANCDYVIVSGATRKEERWDMAENEQILTTGKGLSPVAVTQHTSNSDKPVCPL